MTDMQTAQMQSKNLGTGFAGSKLSSRRGLAGSALRFNASFKPTAARRNGLVVRAEKVSGIGENAVSRCGKVLLDVSNQLFPLLICM